METSHTQQQSSGLTDLPDTLWQARRELGRAFCPRCAKARASAPGRHDRVRIVCVSQTLRDDCRLGRATPFVLATLLDHPSAHPLHLPSQSQEGMQHVQHLIVFVPGLMGSNLLYVGPGPAGNRVEEEIWSEDLAALVAERNLDRLIYPTPSPATIHASYILERVTYLSQLFGSDLYGPLLQHLRVRASESHSPLLEFPYDWRASIRDSAHNLALKIQALLSRYHLHSFTIVSHSKGGLVARLALAKNSQLQGRVHRVIHIASPLRGSIVTPR